MKRNHAWCEALQIDKENLMASSLVCGSHFRSNNFSNSQQSRLKKTAVPVSVDVLHRPEVREEAKSCFL
jgi:hypothetical protein